MLTFEQKIGQMLVVGWPSSNVDEIINLIKTYNFGNIILFSRNIKSAEELKVMCKKIQEAAIKYNGVPAFIALDQEGGSICRLRDGVSHVPGHMAIGAASFTISNAAYRVGSIIGEELKQLGINFNLAPVVDINTNPYNPIIGIRAFSDDPKLVTKLASDFSIGLQSKGVLSTYKHFLGHGNVSVDPIHDLPHLGSTFDEIFELELVPYRGEYLPDSIMAAHIVYDKIDNVFPASMSQKILKEILRNNLNYNGLIVTDCYESGGLQRTFSLPEAAVFSVKATADMILISHNLGKQLMVRNALLEAVNKNYIDLNIIDQAIKRILSTKAKYTKPTELDVDYNRNQIVAHEISLASITIASGKLFEIDKNTVVVGITNYSFPIIEESYVDKLDIAKELGLAFNIPYYSLNNKSFNLNNIIQVCKEKKVILALIDSHITLAQKVLYTTLVQNNNHIMLISMGTPYDILELSKPECHVCLYEYTTLSISSLIRVLKGEPAKGKLPVNISSPLDLKKINSLNVIVKKVLIKLNAQYANEISLDSVALEQNITASHLSRLFKKEMGMTFSEYLMNLRINKAKNLLVTSSLYIYEIANLCGFQDFNYFSKVFKKVTGVTPNDYRNHHYEYNY